MSLIDKVKGKKAEPVPEPVSQDSAPVESLTRLQVVERAGRALKILLPLSALCDELGKLDSLDRELEVARVRNLQAQSEADQLLEAKAAQLATGEQRRLELHAEATSAAQKIVANAQAELASAEKRAKDIIDAAVASAGEKQRLAAAEVDKSNAQAVKVRADIELLDALLAERKAAVAAAEAQIAKAKKAVQALME